MSQDITSSTQPSRKSFAGFPLSNSGSKESSTALTQDISPQTGASSSGFSGSRSASRKEQEIDTTSDYSGATVTSADYGRLTIPRYRPHVDSDQFIKFDWSKLWKSMSPSSLAKRGDKSLAKDCIDFDIDGLSKAIKEEEEKDPYLEVVGKHTKNMRGVFRPARQSQVNFGQTTMSINMQKLC